MMSLKSKKFKLFFLVLLVSIITAVFVDNVLSAKEQSPNSTATRKLKFRSESMSSGDITAIRKLIDAGADVNVINIFGCTPLYIASVKDYAKIVKLLLENSAVVNKADITNGFTPLHAASGEGHVEVVKLLLEAGADVNKGDIKYGFTPLYIASGKGHTEIVKLLLEAGADVNKNETKYNTNPDFIATLNGQFEVMTLLREAGSHSINTSLIPHYPVKLAFQRELYFVPRY
ncbi:MAG: hypothetical protein GY797_38300 [Deltaproteobacteria bacterium]|nr:hypothetical protein [Deltaproteobacteria bacterium]